MGMNFNVPKLNFESMGRISETVKRLKNQENISAMKNTVDTEAHVNPFEDSSMCLNGKEHLKVDVPISEEMTKKIFDDVHEAFRERGGMSGTDYSFIEVKKRYIMNNPKESRISVGYSLDQIGIREAERMARFIRSKDPSWDFGKPVKREIYEEAIKTPSLDTKA